LIFAIIIFGCFTLIAQEVDKSQSIELPAFVITGIQSVSVPTISKKKSEFIPIISNQFLIPNYNTEEFALLDNSSPIKKEMDLNNTDIKYNGLLQLGFGLQTLPIGDLYFGFNKSNYLFNSHVFGSDIRKYIPYSGYNTSGAKAKLNYFVNHNSKILPGLSIGIEGNFVRDLYYFYGTATPNKLRENEFYESEFFVSNQLNKKFKYGFGLKYDNLNMKKDGISENLISGNGFVEYKFGPFGISGSINYQVQKINENLSNYIRADYFEGKGYFHITSSKIFELKFGVQLAQLDTNNIFSPIAILSIFVEKGAALFISYQGNSELVTLQDLLKENRYFEKSISQIFTKRNSEIKVDIKYDFSDVFEVNAGLHFANIDNYHFFEDLNNNNKFNIAIINDVKDIGGFLNVIINAKKYGELFANIQFQNITDLNGFKLPYKPSLKANISYGYMMNFGLYSKVNLNYSKNSYTNLSNINTIPSYINLGLFFKYRVFKSLALTCNLQNLLNRKDFFWNGYQEKPIDAIVGIEYRW